MAFTFFFRDSQVLELAVTHLLPDLAGRSRAKIWDAGCAMGPEVYTLAMLLADRMGTFGFRNLRIDATDIDETGQFEAIVNRGAYPLEELKRMPEGVLERHFRRCADSDHFQISEHVRAGVRFRRHDLLSLQEPDRGYSLIVCKNVLLHFPPMQRVSVLEMFHRALGPGGLLVTEHTQKMPVETAHLFEQVEPHVQLFRRRQVLQ